MKLQISLFTLLAFTALTSAAPQHLRPNTEQNLKNLLNVSLRKAQQKLNQQGVNVNIRNQISAAQNAVQPQLATGKSLGENTLNDAKAAKAPYNSKSLFDLLDLGASII